MSESYISSIPLNKLALWQRMREKRALISFDLEITPRCNNNCRHCYINLPAGDKEAKKKELSVKEIEEISNEAVSLGAVWCLITGGEPLLRKDFSDIYLYLKKKGLLVSVFTNATLLTKDHIKLFKRYPPRDIEVTVYGVSEETYEKVTRVQGSFAAFRSGLDLLLESRLNVRLKAMALRSNLHEQPIIARFCRERTKDYFRFDPFLHLRYDGDVSRNAEIKAERLAPQEIVALEQSDPERFQSLRKECEKIIITERTYTTCDHLFYCGAGTESFSLSYDGLFRLCPSLWHPDCVYDLKEGTLAEAWQNFIPHVRAMLSNRKEFIETCRRCPLINLCMWCPAHAALETGELDAPVAYFCQLAHARADALKKADPNNRGYEKL